MFRQWQNTITAYKETDKLYISLPIDAVPVPHTCSVANQVWPCDVHLSCVACVHWYECDNKIACNSESASQILKFTHGKHAGTHMYPHVYVKFKLSCTT